MATLSRRLPRTKISRHEALNAAKLKSDALGGSPTQLTAATLTRLNAMQPQYDAAMQEVNVKRALLANKVIEKNGYKDTLSTLVRRFIRTFNNGVAIGDFPAGDRGFYGLPTGKEDVPDINSEADLITWANKLIAGDADRTDPGGNNGAPMALPTIAQVTNGHNDFMAAYNEVSLRKEALDTAQEAVDALNEEADGTILKVWDEVETFYNEEEKESQRANAREWGVVYVLQGVKTTTVNLTVKEAGTETPIDGATGTSDEPDLEIITDENGFGTGSTKYVGEADMEVSAPGYTPVTIAVTFTEAGGEINEAVFLTPI